MKKLHTLLLIGAFLSLTACGNNGNQPATAEGFTEIENNIKSEFGSDAYFTDISISYDESIGNMITTTVTKDPSSLKMGQWSQVQGSWSQSSDITIEIPKGFQAADFMYQLNEDINLTQLGQLIEDSRAQLIKQKNVENPVLSIAHIKFPKNGDASKTEYSITLEPENGGTSYWFTYDLSGKLIKMDY